MNLNTFIKSVIAMAEIDTEDLNSTEKNRLEEKIILTANMGMDAIARETYPLEKSEVVDGPDDYAVSDDWIKLLSCHGGKFHRYVDKYGKEHLELKERASYRITYSSLPIFINGENRSNYTFQFPMQVITALMYYCCYHILSPANDKREYAYFMNLYNQQCANIAANLPKRATIVGGEGYGI